MTSQAGELFDTKMYCDTTKNIAKDLKSKYGEIPVMIGATGDEANSTTTIWVNPATETWTIIATKDNASCIIGFGQKLRIIDYKKKNNT